MAEKVLTLADFGLKPGDRVPLGVAVKLARQSPANRIQTGIASIGGASRAISAKLLNERAREEAKKQVDAAVAEALARQQAGNPPVDEDESADEDNDG